MPLRRRVGGPIRVTAVATAAAAVTAATAVAATRVPRQGERRTWWRFRPLFAAIAFGAFANAFVILGVVGAREITELVAVAVVDRVSRRLWGVEHVGAALEPGNDPLRIPGLLGSDEDVSSGGVGMLRVPIEEALLVALSVLGAVHEGPLHPVRPVTAALATPLIAPDAAIEWACGHGGGRGGGLGEGTVAASSGGSR